MVAKRLSSRGPVIIMLFALGVLLLLTGSGIASGIAYWGPLFADQQALRLITFCGGNRVFGEGIRDVWYDVSPNLDSSLMLFGDHTRCRAERLALELVDERYKQLVENHGQRRIIRRGNLLISVSDTVLAEALQSFDEAAGSISGPIVLQAIGNSYRVSLARGINRMHEFPLLNWVDVVIEYVKLWCVRPLIVLAYYYPWMRHVLGSIVVYAPGLAIIVLAFLLWQSYLAAPLRLRQG